MGFSVTVQALGLGIRGLGVGFTGFDLLGVYGAWVGKACGY